MVKIICQNEEETSQLGEKIGGILEAGDCVCLNGDLGAGKTFISKSIIKKLGVEDYITSPSYTIVNEYQGDYKVNHFDVYRIDDLEEMYEIGYEEYFFSEAINVIEWSNMIEELLPEKRYEVTIKLGETFTTRIIEIYGSHESLEKKLEAL